jgi:hypothetical protein
MMLDEFFRQFFHDGLSDCLKVAESHGQTLDEVAYCE